MTAGSAQPEYKTIAISQLIDAPRDEVFVACTEAEHLLQWFRASEDWSTPHASSDPRPGGGFSIGFAGPAGQGFDFDGTYDEVRAPEYLAYTIADGRPVTLSFAEEQGKTRLTLVLALEDMNSEDLQRTGWTAMLARLNDHLK